MDNIAIKFKFYIGGYFGGNSEIIYKENHLHCSVSDSRFDLPSIQIINVLDDTDWEALLEFTRNLQWESGYFDEAILDGTQWSLKFVFKDTVLKTSGSNKYPREFDQFLVLLNKLLSKHNITKVH